MPAWWISPLLCRSNRPPSPAWCKNSVNSDTSITRSIAAWCSRTKAWPSPPKSRSATKPFPVSFHCSASMPKPRNTTLKASSTTSVRTPSMCSRTSPPFLRKTPRSSSASKNRAVPNGIPEVMAPLSAILVLCFIALNTFAQPTPAPGGARPEGPPNIVLIFCDDLAYSDLGCYGNARAKTPHLDRMAREGIRFTDFYVGQPVCSASRAALMTGCYPGRVGIQGALAPKSKIALHTNEITIAELLKTRGYATAIYGKWHLGHTPEFLPTRQGFDDYFGLPYSNDMWPNHPTSGTNFPPLPLIEGERVIQLMPDQTQLTTWYTERAVNFIEKNKERPFFLYVPHNMPHVPLHVSDRHKGKSGYGLYGDVIMEIDWSVGEILAALARNGLDNNTLVIFSSDNGPWLEYGDHAGSALPLREGKMTSFEGGLREPFIVRWPNHVPAGTTSHELVTAMDFLPT